MRSDLYIEASATVPAPDNVGPGTRVWHQAQLDPSAVVGADCVIGKGVYLGAGTVVGDRVKIQNGCGVFGALLEDETMLAPGVYLLEDPAPRATRRDGRPKRADDWQRRPVVVERGATVGANSVIGPGVRVGHHAMVAIGSVITQDVEPHALMAGNPARHVGFVCEAGHTLPAELVCAQCGEQYAHTPGGLALKAAPGEESL